ncbi:hypothetical protein MTR67_043889 [Solanum verrucosum]|uniref:EF-hand domain-containing protein n=4 Tax=Solanum TaxID=4107 RepID=A0ABQ7WDH8_SOLTU|nr:uncharacterized protein LOC125828830 [Solanum verrucosum]XP_049401209.1 uncharacterized protein LOC125865079 [Solanum stenotomum]KAH0722568.1 hypothetical protein KY289_005612 [Solanum tuberosum]KAK4724148.1 hypothetical protein R3W88_026927 [Solanum pinnatisectum]KAH0751953.1 hypothetical protein KY285_005101 [Solanum tuberosum]KAH0778793.1 hypothetical protein KY290_005220 [Solanum tuberosum]WMV50504.1 hypothetical protein MTR67_043889 [Solanum verrucosum]
MSVVVVDGPMMEEFVDDTEAFGKWTDKHFDMLDTDGNGELSRDELQNRKGKFSSCEFELQSKEEISSLYDILIERFDIDKSGTIDRQEFKALTKEIMLAKARGIGNSPVLVILQGDSLVMRVVQRFSAK